MALRVMTWNIWWRFGVHEVRRRAVVEQIRQVDPDVVCLQEVWSDDDADDAHRIADELEMHHVRTAPVMFQGESFGNAILARWPIAPITDEPLPRLDRSPGHRRVLAAAVESPWGPWPVASTHLDHRFDSSATRQLQVEHLMREATTWRGDPDVDLPVVVGADLNAVADSEEVRTVTGRRPGVPGIVFTDVWEQVGEGHGRTWLRENPYTQHSAWPDRRLDYILVSWPRPKPVGNPIRAWTVADEPIALDSTVDTDPIWPSDHAAVVADLVTPG